MRILWLLGVVRDLVALRAFIAAASPEAAAAIADRIASAVEGLDRFPSTGRVGRIADTRELIVAGTPYVLPYRFKDDTIEILRVIHAARKWPDLI